MDTFRLSVKSVHKTAGPRQFYGHIEKLVDLGTFMDTEFQVSQKLPRSNSFMDTFDWQPKSGHKTAKVRSFCGFGLLGLKSVHKTA